MFDLEITIIDFVSVKKVAYLYDPGNHFIDIERTNIHTWTTILVIELPTQEGTSKGVVLKLSTFFKLEKNLGPEGVIIEVYRYAKGRRYV